MVCACMSEVSSVVLLCRFLVSCSIPYVQAASTSPDVAVIKELEDCNKQLAAEAAHAKGVGISLILPHPLLHTPPLSFLIPTPPSSFTPSSVPEQLSQLQAELKQREEAPAQQVQDQLDGSMVHRELHQQQ